jgi:SPP1 gp7 family putative phage head morphogenesis protein
MGLPDPVKGAPSRQPQLTATFTSRNAFPGWWSYLPEFELLRTEHSRIVGNQGIPGACGNTLRHQMAGLSYQVLTDDEQETAETEYYTLLLDNAKDALGNVIGGSGLFDLLAQDVLTAHQGGNVEVVRVRNGRYTGVPISLYALDGASLRYVGGELPVAQVNQVGQVLARFAADEVLHAGWNRYAQAQLTWYNRHPVQQAWIAINALAAGDDYNYSLLTDVIPQGLLNLGPGFDKDKALQWKAAWDAAKVSGKLEDIGLLWGTDKAEFIRFQEVIKDQPFQTMAYWYLTVVTANFEMSPLDIGFMTQINTKAAAETSAELSKNKGLQHLLRTLKEAVEHWILPSHLQLKWEDIDPSDESAEAMTRRTNTEALTMALRDGLLSLPQAQAEALRLGVFEIAVTEEEALDVTTSSESTDMDEADQETTEKAWLPEALRGIRESIARCYADEAHGHQHVAKAEDTGEDYAADLSDAERALLAQLEAEMQAALVAAYAQAGTTLPSPLPGESPEEWAARAASIVSGSVPLASIVAALVPSITALVQAGIEHGEAMIGIPLDFNVNDDAAQRFIAEYGLRIAEKLQETTLTRLTETLLAGWNLGEDMDQLAARVAAVMDDIPDWRALTIARTETIRAFNGGMWLAYQEGGVVVTKRWIDGQPGACVICVDLNGEEVPLGDDFSIGVQFPPAHPRCRCAVGPGKIDVTRYKA